MAIYGRLSTDTLLLRQAARLDLEAPRNATVLWSGSPNRRLAKRFCEAHPGGGYLTLEMVLEQRAPTFFCELCAFTWPQVEEIWYLLSARFAEAAEGAVRVFVCGIATPEGDRTGPVDPRWYRSSHKPRSNARAAYCNSVFEKVEGPALDNNPRADPVFLMGRNINAKPSLY